MRLRGSELEWLLSPLPVDEFVDDIWERKPHVIHRNDEDYYSDLFSGADLDAVLEFGRPRPPDLRVVSEGEGRSPDDYLQADGRLDLNELRKLYAEGNTIVINGLHRFCGPVAGFVQGLQRCLSYKVTPNAYLTPRRSRGLKPHYDTHDVFVVQVGGAKTWRIYDAPEAFPLLGTLQPGLSSSPDELPTPRLVDLAAGDVMYIPRGWVHAAETADRSSLHLTFGIYPPQWYDFMTKALTALTLKHERLRRALPVGYLEDGAALPTLRDGLRELAALLEREGSAADAFGMLEDDFIRVGRAVPDGCFVTDLDRVASIDLQTRLVKRPHLYCRVVPVENAIALQFSRTLVQAPLDYGDAMAFVAQSSAVFTVSDLPLLDNDRKTILAQRLVRDGLLTFADAGLSGDADAFR